ncbi:aromatic acid exporter family protein [Bacillus dakarensis]|uniref:aromatic acid exporter family protein n=1 Tax=Robertmurraya dakarensis TaxID=1926278 RepID=UPI000981C6BA|nr:aromatic acid exporter family protein [Bacillus dakarensis]
MKKFTIGYRTVKTALGTTIAILLALYAGLDNYVSAGILTILCIKVTKKKSIRASWDRILACLIGIVFSVLFFEGLTYHPIIIGLLLIFFIPSAVMVKAQEGIVSSTVIILHIYSAGKFSLELLWNELGIIFIGVGVALIMNLYMPSLENRLLTYQQQIEDNFRRILNEIVIYLRTSDNSWDGKELTETAKLIEEAKTLAFRDVENHFLRNENLHYHYFKMREKQFEVIERVLQLVASLPVTVIQSKMIAIFIEELSDYVSPGEVPINFLDSLLEMRQVFESMPLPKTREEFEVRASLLQLTKEIELYLVLKKSFKNLKKEQKQYKKGRAELN